MSLARYDLAIVGGGFSGTALAFALARTLPPHARIALIERGNLGGGIAYGAPNGLYMNGPAREMSALESDSGDLVRFCGCNPDALVERHVFGEYMRDVLRRARVAHRGIEVIKDDVLDIAEDSDGYRIRARRADLHATRVVLATGTPPPSRRALPGRHERVYQDPWTVRYESLRGHVAVIGSGLTALDTIAQLAHQPQVTHVTVISASGRYPLEERPELRAASLTELRLDATTPLTLLRSLRAAAASEIYDWRSVVDAIRKATPGIWRSWSPRQRAQFLRHGAQLWAVHRYRAPAQTLAVAVALQREGRLTFVSGKVARVDVEAQLGLLVKDGGHIFADAAINASGPSFTEIFDTEPLLHALYQRGALGPDDMGLGFEIDDSLRAAGAYDSLYVIGPATRSRWYEATAVPEIRRQADALAAHLREALYAQVGAA